MTPPGVILVTAVALGAAVLGLRAGRWRQGRPGPALRWRELLAIPRRYLHDVHAVVVRDRPAARMHVTAAGGMLASLILALVVHGLGFTAWPAAGLLMIAAATTVAGGLLDALRRRTPSERLSGKAFAAMPLALVAFGVFLLLATLPLVAPVPPVDWAGPGGIALLGLGALATGFLLVGAARGPMRHAFAGALHLAFHARPERFDGDRVSSDLRPLDLGGDRLGVQKPADFGWRQLLSFDACVQCGRCEVVCPAFAAGAPLNPKKLIFDLCAASDGSPDSSYAGHPHPGVEVRPESPTPFINLVGNGGRISPDTLWACTTCRACVEECPMMIEHVDAIIDLRRYETLEKGATPGKGPAVLERLAETDTVSGRPTGVRMDWAVDLGLPLARDHAHVDVLLWLGEAAFEPRGQRTLRALIEVMRAADVDFAVLGDEELDVGDTARRLGDEALFQSLAGRNIEILARHSFDRIVTNDPHVLHALRNEYPALGGTYAVEHHTTFAADLLKRGKLAPSQAPAVRVTFHDPCYLGRYNHEYDAPRVLLDALGLERVEMERAGPRSFCCGWGGGATVTDVPSRVRIPDLRMSQAVSTGATVVAAACPNCAVMLEGTTGDRLEVLDVIELLAARLRSGPAQRVAP